MSTDRSQPAPAAAPPPAPADTSPDWFLDESQLINELRRSRFAVDATPALPGYADLKEVHRGGQGIVYCATHTATRRAVAVKVLHPSALTSHNARRRFEREVELAATLRHPGVVRVYDSGTTLDGRLYLTMEWIQGDTLDIVATKVDRDQRQIATLLAQVSDALNHAHLHAVIHRDLKPSNIRLSADGTPTILDFGLATASTRDINELTVTGAFLGSLHWCSPEQALGRHAQIDTRTDIYSLGIVLFNLLTGEFPYDVQSDIRTTLNNIAGTQPARLRKLRPDADEDLEVIIAKCLEKDAPDRYQTAADLAKDLRRYLAGEAISAKRASMWESMRRQASRFRMLAWAGALILLIASLSLVFVMRYADNAALERDRARSAIRQAENSLQFLAAMLQGAGPGSGEDARQVRVVEILDRAAANVDRELAQDPTALSALHATIGRSYSALGLFPQSEHHARRALHIGQELATLGRDHPRTLTYEADLYDVLVQQHKYAEAEPLLRALLTRMDRVLGTSNAETIRARNDLARCCRALGNYAEADSLIQTALAALPENVDPELRLSVQGNLAALRFDQKDYAAAEPLLRAAHDTSITIRGRDHPRTLILEHKHALALEHLGRTSEAAAIWRELVPRTQRVLGPTHERTKEAEQHLAAMSK